MTARRPEPGSPWARHCPDAFPRGWLDGGELPAGFARPATPLEADLIAGRVSEAEFLRRSGRQSPRPAAPARSGRRRVPPVVRKLAGWNRFLDALAGREPRLSPLAVAVWCWLWRCERDGLARTSERKLAERFGVGRATVRRRLAELRAAGLLAVARRGTHNRTATVYRVRPGPRVRPP